MRRNAADFGFGSESSACPSTRSVFADNDIDIDVLNELTDQDFDRLGVSLGHRRRMLRAIRELTASPIAAVTEGQTSGPTAPEQAPKDTA